MSKARRFSGNLKIELSFNDRKNQYKARLCPTRPLWKGARCETIFVGVPATLERAVDSPRAYDQAARAAISFAREETQEHAQVDRRGQTWHISRGRRVYVKGHPRRS